MPRVDSKGSDQTVQVYRLILAFVGRTCCEKGLFAAWLILKRNRSELPPCDGTSDTKTFNQEI